jgi:hypothetical protein
MKFGCRVARQNSQLPINYIDRGNIRTLSRNSSAMVSAPSLSSLSNRRNKPIARNPRLFGETS